MDEPSRIPPLCDDKDRLAALTAYDILNTPRERDFDDIAELAAEICQTPIAVVNFIAEGRQWFKAEVGLGVRETPLDTSFCAHALLEQEFMLVPDAAEDPRFADSPLVTDGPRLRFYAGALLRSAEGQPIGTLCVLDRMPRTLTEQQARALQRLARQVMAQLELRRALKARDAAAAHLGGVLDSATDYAIITCDGAGLVTGWNKGAANVLGWSEAEALGQPASMIFTPEDLAAGADVLEMATALTTGRVTDDRFHLRKDGSRFFAQGVMTLLRRNGQDGFLKILRDSTAQRAAVTSLRESEARFRHMADSVPALIWMTDPKGQVTFANMHHGHMFGVPVADMLGRGWGRFVLPDDLGLYRDAFLQAFHALQPFRSEMRVRDKAGQLRWLRCEGVPRLDDAGTFLGYTGCSMDVTEARLAASDLEARIAERTAALTQAVDALHTEALERGQAEEQLRQAQKMEAVGQLTGGIAHDFNNMLQAIAGSLELMRRRVAQGRADETGPLADAAAKTVQRAAALTNRLLAFARRQSLQPRPVDPNALVEGMAELIRGTTGPAVELVLQLDESAPTVLCDPNQLENALLNLAINARDAMPNGGRLTISTARVGLTVLEVAGHEGAQPGSYATIQVADTGIGMAPDVLARVFEPFFTTKPLGQGTGLGLSQLYGFVRQSGGIVRLDSVPGRGTAVRICLPQAAPGSGAQADSDALEAVAHPGAASGTVLLVEDEAGARAMAAEVLGEHGYRVVQAGDGPEALRLVRRGVVPDVLVTDVGLPGGLNGRQVAEAARDLIPGLPVLFMTGYAGKVLADQLAPGMALIGKPFTFDALVSRIRALLNP